ncbi:MAG: hypothetical protein EZS28_036706 [Streblomastix strix]|uniref:C2H2-type domain-containing protein n=1 Tax=Streblomastix strix TaxID=222440 RepID=A0A5J4UB40_9EUKA|nr:MAG: hypothetical protein EZS28_036706 [Streblomastix strix]
MSKKSETEEGKTEFKCPACKEDFKSKEELEEHTFIHDYDEKTNFCHHPGCIAFFDNQRMLITHIKKEHKGKKAFACKSKLCKTSYHTPGRLAAHMKEYHANELSDSEFDEDDDKTDKTDKKSQESKKEAPSEESPRIDAINAAVPNENSTRSNE